MTCRSLVLSLAMICLAATALVAAPDGRLGLNISPDLTPQEACARIVAAESNDVGTVRILLDWERVQPNPGPFDWSAYDAVVDAARAHHVDVVFVLGPTAQWASRAPANEPVEVRSCKMPKDWADWERYVTAAVCHFRGSVKYWQVWEAFDFQHFRAVSSQIEVLAQKTYQAAKTADPACQLILPEVGGIDPGWVTAIKATPLWNSFDILGLRPYRQEPNSHMLPLAVLQSEVLAVPGAGAGELRRTAKPVWILEEAQGLGGECPASDAAAQTRLLQIALAAGVQKVFAAQPLSVPSDDPDCPTPALDLSSRQAALAALQPQPATGRVVFDMEAETTEQGLYAGPFRDWPGGRLLETTEAGRKVLVTTSILGATITEEDRRKDNPWFYFDIDDRFLYHPKKAGPVAITITCRGTSRPAMCGFNIYYDAGSHRKFSKWQWIDAGEQQWFTYRTVLPDAWFANKDGYDFRINTKGSKEPVYVTRVEVEPVTSIAVSAATER